MNTTLTGLSAQQLNTIEPVGTPTPDDGISTANFDALENPDGFALDEPVPFLPVHPLDGIDDDIAADLAAVGVVLAPGCERDAGPAQREAMAALYLRRMVANEAERETIREAMELEVKAIQAHYERRVAPLEKKYMVFEQAVQILAELTQWKKKKSADTPWAFGVRDTSATVEVEDAPTLLAYAQENAPDFVRVGLKLPLPEALTYFTPAEIAKGAKLEVEWGKLKATLKPDGALPPGVVAVPACRTPFAKPCALQAEG